MKILFFGKRGHWATGKCIDFLSCMDCEVESYTGSRGELFPEDMGWLDKDLIISFSSPWVIPEYVLAKAQIAAINFHPGPPEYPGIGCTNFAIYDGASEFGVTSHHMFAEVDSGAIIAVERFPLFPGDTVKSLTDRCYHYMLALFVEVIGGLIAGNGLAISEEKWARPPYTRKELNDLCRIELSMTADEVRRRVRATAYPGHPGARLKLHGMEFEATSE